MSAGAAGYLVPPKLWVATGPDQLVWVNVRRVELRRMECVLTPGDSLKSRCTATSALPGNGLLT